MSSFPCLDLLRAGHDTQSIRVILGMADEAEAYNRLHIERAFEALSRRFDAAASAHVVPTEIGRRWAENNAAKVAAISRGDA